MKKVVFILALLAGASTSSFAQQAKTNSNENGKTNSNEKGKINSTQKGGNGQSKQNSEGQKMTPEQKAEKLTQYMTTSLALTSDQQAKVSALNASKAKQVDAIRTKYKGNMESAKPELKTAKDQYNTSLKAILTPEQQTKWEAIKKQKKEEYQKNKAAGTKPAEGDLNPEDIE